jgi:hypothetical protein
MSFGWLMLLLIISSGGISIGGLLAGFIGWLTLVLLLVFVWEYKVFILTFVFFVVAIKFIMALCSDYLMYKDETPEEREERLKLNKKIKEWQNKNRF